MTDQSRPSPAKAAEQANPNGNGPQRLTGDMGLSSERTEFDGIESTGTVGSAKGSTDGTQPSEPADAPVRPHPQDPAEGADDPEVEENNAEVPAHPNHPSKNPGHSHG
jgi:hypothetical protein